MFDGGVGNLDSQGARIPVEGCVWGPYQGECLVWMVLSRKRLAREINLGPAQLVTAEIPPLIPSYGFTVPVSAEPVPMAEVNPDAPGTVVGALAASWLLMQQPTLVDHTRERPDKIVRRAYARQNRPDPEVTLIDLRRQYVPAQAENHKGEGSTRYVQCADAAGGVRCAGHSTGGPSCAG